jgi:hypothetical protein
LFKSQERDEQKSSKKNIVYDEIKRKMEIRTKRLSKKCDQGNQVTDHDQALQTKTCEEKIISGSLCG